MSNLKAADFDRAVKHIDAVIAAEQHTPGISDAYGRFCLALPHLIDANGLAQTVGFLKAKVKDDTAADERAAKLVIEQMVQVIGTELPGVTNEQTLMTHAREDANMLVLFSTRRLLDAWAYHRRFAESILGAKAGEETGP